MNKEIVKIIKEERQKQGISQVELAKQLGVTERIVRYWEYGQRGIGLENADKALRILGLTYVLGE